MSTLYKNSANTKVLAGDKIPPAPVFISALSENPTIDNDGNPYTSEDGITWQQVTPYTVLSGVTQTNIAYGNNKFVYVADGQQIAYWSGEGMYWSQTTFGGGTPSIWYSVGFGNGIFFVPKYNTTTLIKSTDGKTWTSYPATLPSTSNNNWIGTAYGGGTYIVNSSTTFGYSSDSITWTGGTFPSGLSSIGPQGITYGGGMFSGMGLYSSNGITWSSSTVPSSQTWHKTEFGNGVFVCMATSSISSTPTDKIAYSTNGSTWNQVTLAYSKIWRGLVFGNGKFILLGSAPNGTSRVLLSSTNGSTWTTETPNMYPPTVDAYGAPEY